MAESAPTDQLSLLAMELPEPVTLPEAPTKLETVIPTTATTSVTSIHIPREPVRIIYLPKLPPGGRPVQCGLSVGSAAVAGWQERSADGTTSLFRRGAAATHS